MTLNQAIEILARDRDAADQGCHCHLSAPCNGCVDRPTPEEVQEAQAIILDDYDEGLDTG